MERKVVKADGPSSLDPRSIWRNLLPGRPRVDFLSVERACLPATSDARVGTNFTETCYATGDGETGLRLQWHLLCVPGHIIVHFCSFDLYRDTNRVVPSSSHLFIPLSSLKFSWIFRSYIFSLSFFLNKYLPFESVWQPILNVLLEMLSGIRRRRLRKRRLSRGWLLLYREEPWIFEIGGCNV